MTSICRLAALMGVAVLQATAPLAFAADAPHTDAHTQTLTAAQAQLHAEAQFAFRKHHYAAAYGRFAKLANEGHVPSARVALLMVEQGPALFGTAWSASVPEQLRWRALMINNARAQAGAVDTLRGE